LAAGCSFLAQARVLNSAGGSILVTGLAASAASFLAAAAGNGSLQLVERSALEGILESWNRLEGLENFCVNARGEPDLCLRRTTTSFALRLAGFQFFLRTLLSNEKCTYLFVVLVFDLYPLSYYSSLRAA
jgi:hypothetical protein